MARIGDLTACQGYPISRKFGVTLAGMFSTIYTIYSLLELSTMKKVIEAAWFSVVIVLALSILVEHTQLMKDVEHWIRLSVRK